MQNNWRKDYVRYQKYFLNILAVYQTRPDLKAFLELLLSIGTITLFALFAIRPTLLTITQLISTIREKQETLATMDQKITNLQAAQTLYQREKPRIDLLAQAVPANPTPETYIRQIEGLAQKHSLTILGLTVDETALLGKPAEVSTLKKLADLPQGSKGTGVTITLSGPYPNVSTFLSDFENLRRPAALDNLNMNLAQLESGNTIILTIQARAIYE
jgi:Tfp pilus assembly protein PilO